jgi:RimJ/RimL family protein N-acetyltransferase
MGLMGLGELQRSSEYLTPSPRDLSDSISSLPGFGENHAYDLRLSTTEVNNVTEDPNSAVKAMVFTKDTPIERFQEAAELVNKAYMEKQKTHFDIPYYERTNAKELHALSCDPNNNLIALVNRVNRAIIGFIRYENHHDQDQSYGEFGLFAISPEYRGKGLGEKLIRLTERHAAKIGQSQIRIDVFTYFEKLKAYYIRLGYVLTGRVKAHEQFTNVKPEYQIEEDLYLEELSKDLSFIKAEE